MKQWLLTAAILTAGCDSEIKITPDQVEPSVTSAEASTSVGVGGAGGADVSTGGAGGESSSVGGAPPTEPPGYESGSRLRARVAVGDDGSKVFLGMRDTELDIDCSWATAGDCALRCLPAAAVVPSTIHYDPTTCDQPVVTVRKGAPKPTYAVLPDVAGSCPDGLRVFVIGDQKLTSVGLPTTTACNTTTTPTAKLDAYSLGTEMAASTFQLGIEDVE